MLRPALVPTRWLVVISITMLGLIAGAILGYTATFFAYLWLHPPPGAPRFRSANTFSLGGPRWERSEACSVGCCWDGA